MKTGSGPNDDGSTLGPTAASILGIKGPLRFKPHGLTQKPHLILRRVEVQDDSAEKGECRVYFSLFANKRIEVKPGKEILMTVASEDGRFDGQAIVFEGLFRPPRKDGETEEEEEPEPPKQAIPPKMRRWTRPAAPVERVSVGVQVEPECVSASVQTKAVSSPTQMYAPNLPSKLSVNKLVAVQRKPEIMQSLSPMEMDSVKSTHSPTPAYSPPRASSPLSEDMSMSPRELSPPVIITSTVNATPFAPGVVVKQEVIDLTEVPNEGAFAFSQASQPSAQDAAATTDVLAHSFSFEPKQRAKKASIPNPFVSAGFITEFNTGGIASDQPPAKELAVPSAPDLVRPGFKPIALLPNEHTTDDNVDTPRSASVSNGAEPAPDVWIVSKGVTIPYRNRREKKDVIPKPAVNVKLEIEEPSIPPLSEVELLRSRSATQENAVASSSKMTLNGANSPLSVDHDYHGSTGEIQESVSAPRTRARVLQMAKKSSRSKWDQKPLSPEPEDVKPVIDASGAIHDIHPTNTRPSLNASNSARPSSNADWTSRQPRSRFMQTSRHSTGGPVTGKKPVMVGNSWSRMRTASLANPAPPIPPSQASLPRSATPSRQGSVYSYTGSGSPPAGSGANGFSMPGSNGIPSRSSLNTFQPPPPLSAPPLNSRWPTDPYQSTYHPASSQPLLPPPRSAPNPSPINGSSSSLTYPLPVRPLQQGNRRPSIARSDAHQINTRPWSPPPYHGVKRERSASPDLSSGYSHSRPNRRTFPWPTTDSLQSIALKGMGNLAIHKIVFNSDGSQFALSCADRTIRVWNNYTHLEIARLSHNAPVIDIYWIEGDGGVVSLGDDGMLSQWIRSGQNQWQWAKVLDVCMERRAEEDAICMALTSTKIAIAFPHTGVKVWFWGKGQWLPQRSILRHNVTSLKFISDGDALIGGTKDGVLWYCEVPNGTLRAYAFMKSPISSIDISLDKSHALVAVRDGSARLVGIRDNNAADKVRNIYATPAAAGTLDNFGAAFASRGEAVLFASAQGCMLVWNKTTAEIVTGFDHGEGDDIRAVATYEGTSARNLNGYIITGTTQGCLTWWPQPIPPNDASFSYKRYKSGW